MEQEIEKILKEEEEKLKGLLKEKEEIEKRIFELEKEKLKEKREKLEKEKEELKKKIEEIEEKEREIKKEKAEIEKKEEEEKDWFKKRMIERKRWELESREEELEKTKWELEDNFGEKEKEINEIEAKEKEKTALKAKAKEVKKQIQKIEKELEIKKKEFEERKILEEEFKKAWEEYLSGNVLSALEKLKNIYQKLAQRVKETPKEKLKREEFFKPLEYYQKGEITSSLESLEKILKELKEKPEEKAPSLIIKEVPEKKEQKMPPPVVVVEKPQKEEEEEMIKKMREELEEKLKESLKAMIEGREMGLKEARALQEELIQKEAEIERKFQERIAAQKEKLKEREKELLAQEESLLYAGLTEEEKKQREEMIKNLRERIVRERVFLEKKELFQKKEREEAQKRKLKILEDVFLQGVSFYNEGELEKAKRVFDIVKEQLEQAKKFGLFVNIESLPIYTQSLNFIQKIKEVPKEEKKVKIKEIKKEEKKRFKLKKFFSFSFQKFFRFFRELFFPLPVVGLDFSISSLELLSLNKKGELLTFARETLRPEVFVGEKVKNPKLFSQAISSLLKKAGFPPFRPRKGPVVKAIVSLPETAVYVAIFRLAKVENLFEEVKKEVEKTFLFPIEEIYYDYFSSGKDKFGRFKIICAAVKKEIVENLAYLLRANGIEPITFDISPLSIGRALFSLISPSENLGVVDIGTYISTFNIYDKNGTLDFSITFPYGIFNLEKIKEIIQKLISEVKNALDYYQFQFEEKINKIILIGGGACVPEVVEMFEKSFPEIKIELFNPFSKIEKKEAPLFINALGLALRAFSKTSIVEGINLLPEELKRKEKEALITPKKRFLSLIRMILILLLFFLLIIFILYFVLKRWL